MSAEIIETKNTIEAEHIHGAHEENSPIVIDLRGSAGERGMNYIGSLHTLPEFSQDDKELSIKLLDLIAETLLRLELETCWIKVSDGHKGEENDPHYQLEANIGNTGDRQLKASVKFPYQSIEGSDKDHVTDGFIKIEGYFPDGYETIIPDVLIDIIGHYDQMMDDYYRDCKIGYDRPVYQYSWT